MEIPVWYKIKYGLKNLWKWRKIVWADRDWDWVFLCKIMQFKLRNMADHFEKYSYHVNADRDAKQMRICAELLRRLSDDDYFDEKFRAPWVESRSRACAENREYKAKEDLNYFGKLFTKYLRCWWC